jgi:mannosyltransferase
MDRRQKAVLAGLLVLGALLRLVTLGHQSLWSDEAVTAQLVGLPLDDMLRRIPDSESTPPLFYVLLWGWVKVLGDGDAALRGLSALAGILTIPAAWWAGARLAHARAGLWLAALATSAPILVWFSQEARAYALLVLLCTLTIPLVLRAVERPVTGRLLAWGAVAALALATHYFAGFVVLGEALWLAARMRPWRRVAEALALPVLAVLALLPVALDQAGDDRAGFIRETALGTRLLQIPKQFAVGYDLPAEVPLTVVALALVALGVGLAFARGDEIERRGARRAAGLAGVALGVPLLLALAGPDFLITRNVLGAWPAAAAVPAIGFGARRAGLLGPAAGAALCLLGVAITIAVASDAAYQRPDWRGAAREAAAGPGPAAVATTPISGRPALERYLHGRRVPAAGVRVREIVVLALSDTGTGGPPPARAAPPAPPGFSAGRRTRDGYTAIHFRAPTPQVVTPATLQSLVSGPALLDVTP